MAATLEVKYFNTFWLKKIKAITDVENTTAEVGTTATATTTITLTNVPANNDRIGAGQTVVNNTTGFTGIVKVISLVGQTLTIDSAQNVTLADVLAFTGKADIYQIPKSYTSATNTYDWYVEESRIRGGYNNTSSGYGAKAYIVEENSVNQNLFASLIYSGIYNSRTGVNNTNQFSVGEDITRSTNPANGSIQKLYAENTNLIIFQEDKVSRALIDKDAIYSAEGNAVVTSTPLVIGQVVAYAGEYGISQDPFSFAVYGYRKYFTDRKRNVVLRLSKDGITEISSYGMHDYFRDELSGKGVGFDAGSYPVGNVIGGWDIHTKNYILSIQGEYTEYGPTYYQTLAFDESVLGWTSKFGYDPKFIVSIGANMFSYNDCNIYQHHLGTTWYGIGFGSNVTLVLNSNPSIIKNFKTLNYEGTSGWDISNITASSGDTAYNIGKYAAITNLSGFSSTLLANTFKKKENKYIANILNSSPVSQGEVIWGADVSGLKGFFMTVKVNTTLQSQELFSVSTDIVESSY